MSFVHNRKDKAERRGRTGWRIGRECWVIWGRGLININTIHTYIHIYIYTNTIYIYIYIYTSIYIYIYERADLFGNTKIRAGGHAPYPPQMSSKWSSCYRSTSAWSREGAAAQQINHIKKTAFKHCSEMARQFSTRMVQVDRRLCAIPAPF